MQKLAFLSCALFFAFNNAQAGVNDCVPLLNRELQHLGMGSVEKPAEGVKKTVHDHSVSEASVSFLRGNQLVRMEEFLGGKRIFMTNASLVFGGQEKKTLILNDQCQIRSLELAVAGTGIHVYPEICQGIDQAVKDAKSADDYEARVRKLSSAFWTSTSFLIDNVRDQCDHYRGGWAAGITR
jgi:hypothetical protein